MHRNKQKSGMKYYKIHNSNSAPVDSIPVLENIEKQSGYIPNLYGILANSPLVLKAYVEMAKLFGKTSFTNTEKNIIWLTISHTNSCHYCMAIHTMAGQIQNLSEDIINDLREGKNLKDPKLEALRRFTSIMVDSRGWAPAGEVEKFLVAGYSREQLLELMIGIAQKTISNYINHIVDTPLDDKIKPYKWEADKLNNSKNKKTDI